MRTFLLGCLLLYSYAAYGYEHSLGQISTDLVPGPVDYAVIAPKGYRNLKNLPLVLNLHGGGGSRDELLRQADMWQRLWREERIPPAVVAMASVRARSFYMNFHDGSERWEAFMVGPFLNHLRSNYPVSKQPKQTFITGISMGGMGSLRIAFRNPDQFGAVAALEPGIEPILKFSDMQPKHRFWRTDAIMQQAFGNPIDHEYWAANNPATMVMRHREKIRGSGLQIYIEAGDEDQFWLYEGTEFLHQVLWQQRIKHEYHLVRGADHVGPSLSERIEEATLFLFRYANPWPKTQRMKRVDRFLGRQKRSLGDTDHYGQRP